MQPTAFVLQIKDCTLLHRPFGMVAAGLNDLFWFKWNTVHVTVLRKVCDMPISFFPILLWLRKCVMDQEREAYHT